MKIVIAPDSFKESLSADKAVRLLNRDFQPYFLMRAMSVYRSPMVEKEPWMRWWLRPAGNGFLWTLVGRWGKK